MAWHLGTNHCHLYIHTRFVNIFKSYLIHVTYPMANVYKIIHNVYTEVKCSYYHCVTEPAALAMELYQKPSDWLNGCQREWTKQIDWLIRSRPWCLELLCDLRQTTRLN